MSLIREDDDSAVVAGVVLCIGAACMGWAIGSWLAQGAAWWLVQRMLGGW